MAIGHIQVNVHSRAKGHTAAAAVAYRCGLELTCPRTGQHFDYSRRADRQDIGATGLTPGSGFASPADLAAAIETAERRTNSRLLRDVQIALPAELHDGQRTLLAARFAAQLAERYGTVVAWAVHRPDKRGDKRNHHGHLIVPCRRVDGQGQLGEKIRELDDQKTGPEEIARIRKMWQECANEALRKAELDVQIDTGRVAQPAPTLGASRTAIERRAWSARHDGRTPPAIAAAELVEDGAVTTTGRHLARHHRERSRAPRHRRRRTREERSQAVPAVSHAEARMDAAISSKTNGGGSQSPLSAPVRLTLPLVSPADAALVSLNGLESPQNPTEEIAFIDRELAEMRRELRHAEHRLGFELREIERAQAKAPAVIEEIPAVSEHTPPPESKVPLDLTAEKWRSNLFPDTPEAPHPPFVIASKPAIDKPPVERIFVKPEATPPPVEPIVEQPAAKPQRRRPQRQDWTVRGMSQSATGRRPDEAPPQTTSETGSKSFYQLWLEEAERDAQAQDANARTREPPRAESRDRDTETQPVDEVARARRRSGPAIAAHADNHGVAPTTEERERAMRYLDGGKNADDTQRPSLGSALDRCAQARLAGETLKDNPFNSATRSPAGADTARRMTEESIDNFKADSILRRFVDWQRSLRSRILNQILEAITPAEVQQARDDDKRERADRRVAEELRRASQRAVRKATKAIGEPSAPATDQAPARKPDPDLWC